MFPAGIQCLQYSIENKYDPCRGKDCTKIFCESLREHEMKRINFEKKKMILLTNEQQESYEERKICYIYNKSLNINTLTIKIIVKLNSIVIILVNTEALHIGYTI